MIAGNRNRLVTFRLSEDEHRTLRQACEHRGGRNVSEFTRSEVLEFLRRNPRAESAQARCETLEEELTGLKSVVLDLRRRLGKDE